LPPSRHPIAPSPTRKIRCRTPGFSEQAAATDRLRFTSLSVLSVSDLSGKSNNEANAFTIVADSKLAPAPVMPEPSFQCGAIPERLPAVSGRIRRTTTFAVDVRFREAHLLSALTTDSSLPSSRSRNTRSAPARCRISSPAPPAPAYPAPPCGHLLLPLRGPGR
jgi:hypothetical protein